MPVKRSRTPTKASPTPAADEHSALKKAKTAPVRAGSAASTPKAAKSGKKEARSENTHCPKAVRALQVEPLVTDELATADVAAPPGASSSAALKELQEIVLRSKVIAPDVSGIACLAVNQAETEVAVALENGSLVLYSVEYFQSIPHFTKLRHTGGRLRRTLTRIAFLDLSLVDGVVPGTVAYEDRRNRFLVASYLSGQLVIYDSETLFPVSFYQRTGGAVWDFAMEGGRLYTAVSDGSWHQLKVTVASTSQLPQLELERIIPGVSGADRAFSVASSTELQMVVGTDDAGNVHTWRLATASESPTTNSEGRAAHESMWTTRLPKGMALCATIAPGTRPAVAVGTSMGDVVLLEAATGHIISTFTQHKGPVCTIVCDHGVIYASGWHESLRSYRCTADGEWHPAEVKRRTHYHEASQLVVLSQRQLILSASRDGTIMYAPLAQLFSAPALYVTVSTQQFAFASRKDVLLHTRLGRVEGFRMDAAQRHWVPLFAHSIHGKFHLRGLWCDADLHYVAFSTDERVVVSRIVYREGSETALVMTRIEELVELPAGCGVLDVLFTRSRSATSTEDAAADRSSETGDCAYVLYDDAVVSITLTEGYPQVRTAFPSASSPSSTEGGHAALAATSPLVRRRGIRPMRLVCDRINKEPVLFVFGLRGTWQCRLSPDGTPDTSSFTMQHLSEAYRNVQIVPAVCSDAVKKAAQLPRPTVTGLSTGEGRYVRDLTTAAPSALSESLPHDTTFVAQLPTAESEGSSPMLLGFFARGIILAESGRWRMAARMAVQAAFVMRDRRHVLVLERNLEKTLEALPLCWKVRRFGN